MSEKKKGSSFSESDRPIERILRAERRKNMDKLYTKPEDRESIAEKKKRSRDLEATRAIADARRSRLDKERKEGEVIETMDDVRQAMREEAGLDDTAEA